MGKKIFHYFKSRPGLFILILLLLIITVTNLKPDFYLLGWDNYSSYFNLKTNIFRTFFATWREYRGLGVPSDSESTDLFRQLFYLILSPVIKTQLLDQIYILFAFSSGTLLMYFFANSLFHVKGKHNSHTSDVIGFVSSLFYLFNLNTLATFYFPMIMFVNRFYTFPLLLLLLSRIIHKGKESTGGDYGLFIVAGILTSGTYMTATVFVTFVISIFIYLFFAGKSIKQLILLFLIFIGLNSFWFLPFVNYTVQRSGIVYSAPTFIEANEIQLNKPASFYSWDKQLILYPNFFDTPIDSFNRTAKTGYHPIIAQLNNPAIKLFIFLFPILFILGATAILLKPKQNKRLLWIPSTLFLYIWLSFKAFSPLGFVYVFLEKHLPFFANLFRFGDTKFHFFIAFTGALAIGYLFSIALQKISIKSISIVTAIILFCGLFTFRDYVSGHLLGFFMRNKIPSAYFQLANTINSDKGEGRVLHLPYDQNGYWRSYSWGYLGSSFLHFMINHPLLEKTFEPASSENARLNALIYDEIANSQITDSLSTYQDKTTRFYQLLKKTGVKYIVMDDTVSSEQPVRGISLWGRFNEVDSKSMISHLERMGYVKKSSSYKIVLSDYLDAYEKIFPLSADQIAEIQSQSPQEIALYEVKESDPQVRVSNNFSIIDNNSDVFNINSNLDTIQKAGIMGVVFPFQRVDAPYHFENGNAQLSLGNTTLKKDSVYLVTLPPLTPNQEEQSFITIYAKREKENVLFTIYTKPTPDIVVQGRADQNLVEIKKISVPLKLISAAISTSVSLQNYLSNWQALPYKTISKLRIQIGDTILPVPSLVSTDSIYVGSLVSPIGDTSFRVLIPQNTTTIQGSALRTTDTPNCYADKLGGYSYAQNNENGGGVTISSVNGSTCFLSHLTPLDVEKSTYVETHFSYKASQKDTDHYSSITTSKSNALQTILSLDKPNILSVCLKDANTPTCYNTHQTVSLQSEGELIIPTEKVFSAYDPVISFALKNTGLQSQNITIPSITLTSYKEIQQNLFSIPSYVGKSFDISPPADNMLSIQFELPMNISSFYQVPQDAFQLSNGLCSTLGSYRSFRQIDSKLLSYFVGCDSNFSIPLSFNSNSLSVWSLDYNLASGKFPRFVASDGFITYASEYLSLHQGYPSLPGFLSLQNPETFFSKKVSSPLIQSLPLASTNITIPPHSEYQDTSPKNFQIAQDSENEGIALYNNMRVLTLPNTWSSLSIAPIENEVQQNRENIQVSSKQILPSLWKVKLNPVGKGMVVFNEAYDAQWGVYANWGDIISGRELQATHYKCNGFANCFDIKESQDSFYIFYLPEKLNILGWIATFLIVFFAFFLVKKFKQPFIIR